MNRNQNLNLSQNQNLNQSINGNYPMNQNANINQSKQQLMKTIYEAGFAALDTALFLDTHPCDTKALAFYQKMNHIYNQASKEYSTLYGPLRMNQIDNDQYWSWCEEPWPWEMGAC